MILLTFGTRPELIKIAPIIHEFERRSVRGKLLVVHTGQHRELIQADIEAFGIKPDYALELKREGSNLSNLVGQLLLNLGRLVDQIQGGGTAIRCIMAQGDTASVYCSALQAFHSGIPFYHIEAGLRTYDFSQPFPEEYYRTAIAPIASLHFAPTQVEYDNLVKEGVAPRKITITGNTVIDNLKRYYRPNGRIKKQVLITLHRREIGVEKKTAYIEYFKTIATRNASWQFIWLGHPGTQLRDCGLEAIENLTLSPPVSYFKMLALFSETALVFTDSGGIQEEAGYLGIPCIIARNDTERVQGIANGVAKMIDLNTFNIEQLLGRFDKVKLIFQNRLYGRGDSAELILDAILSFKGRGKLNQP